MESWSGKNLITKEKNTVTWEYASLHFSDIYEEILLGRLIYGPHFYPIHYAW